MYWSLVLISSSCWLDDYIYEYSSTKVHSIGALDAGTTINSTARQKRFGNEVSKMVKYFFTGQWYSEL